MPSERKGRKGNEREENTHCVEDWLCWILLGVRCAGKILVSKSEEVRPKVKKSGQVGSLGQSKNKKARSTNQWERVLGKTVAAPFGNK